MEMSVWRSGTPRLIIVWGLFFLFHNYDITPCTLFVTTQNVYKDENISCFEN